MITLFTLYQCDKFIIHLPKNRLLYLQCVQSRSVPSVLDPHKQNLTNSTLYKQSVVPKQPLGSVAHPLCLSMFVLLIEISYHKSIICFNEVQKLVLCFEMTILLTKSV